MSFIHKWRNQLESQEEINIIHENLRHIGDTPMATYWST